MCYNDISLVVALLLGFVAVFRCRGSGFSVHCTTTTQVVQEKWILTHCLRLVGRYMGYFPHNRREMEVLSLRTKLRSEE